jgi:hypothetical protein
LLDELLGRGGFTLDREKMTALRAAMAGGQGVPQARLSAAMMKRTA